MINSGAHINDRKRIDASFQTYQEDSSPSIETAHNYKTTQTQFTYRLHKLKMLILNQCVPGKCPLS